MGLTIRRTCFIMDSVFGNGTEELVGWQPEPKSRGTFNILSTCLITITLCVWTVVHMDLPEKGQDNGHGFIRRKSKWVLVGLLAPEIVVASAWDQRQDAKDILKEARNSFKWSKPRWYEEGPVWFRRAAKKLWGPKHSSADKLEHSQSKAEWHQRIYAWAWNPKRWLSHPINTLEDESETIQRSDEISYPGEISQISRHQIPALPRRSAWTMTHGFYVAMGGFVLEPSGRSSDAFLPASRKTVCLLPGGLRYILRNAELLKNKPTLVPNISETDILDKSKASALAKTFVCLQALWFCAQCITRLAQRLPISLLEVSLRYHENFSDQLADDISLIHLDTRSVH